MSTIRKNGKQYDSGDVEVAIMGILEEEVLDITYDTNQEHQLNHSLRNKATSWSMGKISPQASITLYMTAASKLEKAAGGSLLNIKPFYINVSFVNEFNDIVNDTLLVKFQSQGRTVNGQMGLSQQYQLFAMDIDYNNV